MSLDPHLLDVLACPEDRGPLLYFAADGFLYNPRLKRQYRVEDGVPVMLIHEAKAVGEDEHRALLDRAAKLGISPNFKAP